MIKPSDAIATPMMDLGAEAPAAVQMSRRAMLSGTTAGAVLVASGWLLPDDEADALAGAYGGRLGGRHGKDRRGRDKRKRRDRADNKDHNSHQPPRSGDGPFRDTALTVAFAVPSGYPFSFSKTFFYRQKTGLGTYGPWIASSVDRDRYDPPRFRVGVLVRSQSAAGPGPDLVVDVRNHPFLPPIGNIHSGSGLDPSQNLR